MRELLKKWSLSLLLLAPACAINPVPTPESSSAVTSGDYVPGGDTKAGNGGGTDQASDASAADSASGTDSGFFMEDATSADMADVSEDVTATVPTDVTAADGADDVSPTDAL